MRPRDTKERRLRNRDEEDELNDRLAIELPGSGEKWVPPVCYCETPKGAVKATLPENGSIETVYSFFELPISMRTLEGLSRYNTMTKIQFLTIPHILAGRDVIGEAATGGGKTLCFVIPILEGMVRETWDKADGLYAMIITPTRELAMQIFDVIATFKRHDGVSAMCVFGGKHISKEQNRIGSVGILIGTPGRILCHLDESHLLRVQNVKFLVLDEADKLIEMGFSETTQKILEALPSKTERQNLFFSATMRGAVRVLGQKFCREGETEMITENFEGKLGTSTLKAKNLSHCYVKVPFQEKVNVLASLLTREFKQKILVFCSTIKQVRFLYETLRAIKTGARIIELHGGQDQGKRLAMYEEFSQRQAAMTLITTDLLGRGLDFAGVNYVIQFDCPPDLETYTHRAGRTARGLSNSGKSILFVAPSEVEVIRRITLSGIQLEEILVNKQFAKDIKPLLRTHCARDDAIKHLAIKAFQSYIKAYSIMKNKRIFNLKALLSARSALAASLGLISTPPLPNGVELQDSDSDETTDHDSDTDRLSGGVQPQAPKTKNKTKLERLKEKVAAKKQKAKDETTGEDHLSSDEEGKRPKLTRREKRRHKLQELREMGTEELMKDVGEKLIVAEPLVLPAEPQGDWRDSARVQQALKKKRLVIRADGTAKLKGAGPIQTEHKYFPSDDDEKPVDMNTFEGVVSMMQADQDTETREERLKRLRYKLETDKKQKLEEKHKRRRTAKENAAQDDLVAEDELEAQLAAEFGI
ncbi:RNA helicase [Gregarina niphandrodes]|uniref:ATP-dependent RNA helicase n=1 Tax=Gregarina niphandrodes TaxID=110365 RepID=A0A023B7M0_GRENI|nr:RNA helicase [Gregarina niphandrodes]EZG67515.1 RNA helicase [Gregarina niphandrodes]|eukprot:XP_011130230.1 RNA helicase [Gregarina niphandrodes]